MPERERNYEDELEAVMNALAESVVEAPDADLLEELLEEGVDLHQYAEETRDVLLDAMKQYKMDRLRAARSQYEEEVQRMRQREYQRIPADPVRRRGLLEALFGRRPELRAVLVTAQFREFESLGDDDVEGLLKHLEELGMLNDHEGDANE